MAKDTHRLKVKEQKKISLENSNLKRAGVTKLMTFKL